MLTEQRCFPLLLVAWATYLIAFLILDFQKVWMHREFVDHYLASAVSHGSAFAWSDFSRALGFMEFDRAPRPRFLSSLCLIWTAKSRLVWEKIFPPHPSLSLTWIFTLGLVPWLYFQTACRLLKDRRAAWLALLLLLCSAGYLSGVSMLFHPAKPMAVFCIVFSLYLASRLDEGIKRRADLGWREWIGWGLLVGMVFIGFGFDETTWFILVAVPFYFSDLFLLSAKRHWIWLSWLSIFPVFLLVITFLVPRYSPGFDFWHYALGTNQPLRSLGIRPFFANGLYLVASQLSWIRHGGWALGWVGLHAALLGWFSRSPSRDLDWRDDGRWIAVPLLFVIFDTFLLTRLMGIIDTTYYYASVFPLFFSLMLARILSRMSWRRSGLVLVYLMAISLHHFELMNRRWRDANSAIGMPVSRTRVWELWRESRHHRLGASAERELILMSPGIAQELKAHD